MNKNITNLTRDGLILLEEGVKTECFLQILKIEEVNRQSNSSKNPSNSSKNRYFKVILNDGFSQNAYMFITAAAQKVESIGVFTIIKPSSDIKTMPNYKMKLIMDFEVINDRVKEIVGNPIEFETYKKNNRMNLDGNTSIPFKYLQIKESFKPKDEEFMENEEIYEENIEEIERNQVEIKEEEEEFKEENSRKKDTGVKEKENFIVNQRNPNSNINPNNNMGNKGNIGNIGNKRNMDNRGNMGNMENIGNKGNMGNLIGNMGNLGDIGDMGNMENIGNSIGNIGNMGNIGNNGNIGNMGNIGNIGNMGEQRIEDHSGITRIIGSKSKDKNIDSTIESSRKSFFDKFKNLKPQLSPNQNHNEKSKQKIPNENHFQTPNENLNQKSNQKPNQNSNQKSHQTPNNKKPDNQNFNQSINQNLNKEFFFPIAALRPTIQDWRLKARVIKKNELKSFISPYKTHPSKLLKITIIDKSGDEIGAVFYDKDAEYFYDIIEEGKIYGFSRGTVKEAKAAFNMTKHKYEITFTGTAEIVALEDDGEIFTPKFEFCTIKEILMMNVNEIVDVRGIVYECDGSSSEIKLKSGEKTQKKIVVLYDEFEDFIEITLWGKEAALDFPINEIAIFKRLRVSEFSNKKCLNTTFDTVICPYNESLPELEPLLKFAQSDKPHDFLPKYQRKSLSLHNNFSNDQLYTVEQMTEASKDLMFSKDKRIFVGFFYILRFNSESSNLFYASCINEKCNKKVFMVEEGFRCENCQKVFPEPKYRYILQAYIADHTESLRITIFDEVANEILGITAKEMKTLKEESLIDEMNSVLNKGKFMDIKGKVMARYGCYQGVEKIDYSLIGFQRKSHKECIRNCLSEIDGYLLEERKNLNIN